MLYKKARRVSYKENKRVVWVLKDTREILEHYQKFHKFSSVDAAISHLLKTQMTQEMEELNE